MFLKKIAMTVMFINKLIGLAIICLKRPQTTVLFQPPTHHRRNGIPPKVKISL